MSDHAIRGRQRRAAVSGSLEDRASHLVARVRAGTLTRERLELAAYCGDEAAFTVAQWEVWPQANGRPTARIEVPAMRSIPRELDEWVRGLHRWDDESHTLGVRVGIAACIETWHALVPAHAHQRRIHVRAPHEEPRLADHPTLECYRCDGLDAPMVAIVAAQAWLACPCEWHAEAASAAGQSLSESVRWWGMLALYPAGAASREAPTGARCARLCVDALDEQIDAAAVVHTGIRRELAAWALREVP